VTFLGAISFEVLEVFDIFSDIKTCHATEEECCWYTDGLSEHML